jgi:alkanesulfonate monooxygenase SsuD/methylene tetrahydromethanopterin reductase-like flavin-dependent oxidoreductase (luciferase family)
LKLGVALGWHSLSFEARVELTRRAEELGYAVVFVDGDGFSRPSLGETEILDGLTVTTELLARTQRIEVTSLRLVHHWSAAHLAHAMATLARIHPGRVRLFVSIGAHSADRRFGVPFPPTGERIRWLDETLDALRRLWRGETVTSEGRYVRLDGARLRPTPAGGGIPVHVAGQGARLLQVVARHGDAWDVNLPPVRARVERAAEHLQEACLRQGRDPDAILRSLWIFVRPDRDPRDPTLWQEFVRLNPWFADLSEPERKEAIVAGTPGECRNRIARLAQELGLQLPVADLSGLDAASARNALEALGPKKSCVDSNS